MDFTDLLGGSVGSEIRGHFGKNHWLCHGGSFVPGKRVSGSHLSTRIGAGIRTGKPKLRTGIGNADYYKSHPKPIGKRRVDFLVEELVLVELKAITELREVHFAQIINYLEAYRLEIGLLINFGEKSLQFKRFIKDQPRNKPQISTD